MAKHNHHDEEFELDDPALLSELQSFREASWDEDDDFEYDDEEEEEEEEEEDEEYDFDDADNWETPRHRTRRRFVEDDFDWAD